jgi:predicted transposase YbfD/YdcC
MPLTDSPSILSHFAYLNDPRIDRLKLYPLSEVLLLTICSVICGFETYEEIVDFGRGRIDFLRQYLPFNNGIPSKSTLARIFSLLEPESFKNCFVSWVNSFQKSLEKEEVIAIDGKTLRRSFDLANDNKAIHMVSAFASKARLVLGQIKVDEKSNEITAIPKLLDILSIKGAIVTIDAMGCQTEIAKKIIEKEGDYLLALKGNQGNLYDDVKCFFDSEIKNKDSEKIVNFTKKIDYGHGRIEIRKVYVSDKIDWLDKDNNWKNLSSISMIECERIIKGEKTNERRYFISSLPANAKLHLKAIRSHWAIENTLHWTLDMVFREDESRIRNRNSSENMAIIRHTAMNFLQSAKKDYKNMSIKRLRKKAVLTSNVVLNKILTKKF